MSISFHEEYGIKPIVVGRAPLPFTEGSTIIDEFYYTDRIDEDEYFVDYLKDLAKKYHSNYENLLLIGTNDEIGRASCREREKMWGVGKALKRIEQKEGKIRDIRLATTVGI